MPSVSPQGEKPRILHIFFAEKFIDPLFDFLDAEFEDFQKHILFCVGLETRHPLRRRPNSRFISDYRRRSRAYFELVRQMYKADRIVLHGLWSQWVVRVLSIQPWLLSKCYWLIWGGDLYSYKFAKRTIRWRITEIPRRIVIPRIGHLVTYVEGDVNLARQWYGARGEYLECLMYPSNLYKAYDVPPKTDNTVHIQIGNSADPRNEHFEMLEMLKPYAGENIKIYAILSYGPDEHAAEVAEAGREIFGEKFIAITDFMASAEYIEFLGKIDIAVFNHKRQQGMGNIITLLGMGKTVYLRSDVTSWKMFEELGIRVLDIEAFDLSPADIMLHKDNPTLIKSFFSKDKLLDQLKEVFE